MGCGNSKSVKPVKNKTDEKEKGLEVILNPKYTMREDDSQNLLADHIIYDVNFNFANIKIYYKNQKPPISTELFTDILFPPNRDSLFGIKKDGSNSDPYNSRREEYFYDFNVKEDNVEWRRASEIFESGKFSIFEGKIEFDDIKQGNVGNCYFMAALSAMTEFPQLICQIFKSFSIQSNGCYEIAMRINGEWKIVLIDDYIPCEKGTKTPLFSKPNGNELWVMLLEKAWAKINGGYLNIVGGWSTQVLSVLTPFSMEYLVHDKYTNDDELWEKIREADSRGYVMSCCSKRERKVSEMGIVPGHAFSLISAKERVINRKNIRLVQIRNPWGYREWKGDWSDSSNLWTDEAKIAFGFGNKKDDGLFWMAWEDYLMCYEVTEMCKVSSPRCFKSLKITKENLGLSNFFELIVSQKSTVDISAIKKNWRFNRRISSDQELMINLILVKVEDNQVVYVSSACEALYDPVINVDLEKGKYLIYVHANNEWAKVDKNRKYLLYVSCDNYFDIRFKGTDDKFDLLKEIIIRQIRSKNRDTGYVQLIKHSFEHTKFGYLYIWNNTKFKYEIVGENESENFKILTEFNGRVNIPPNNDWIILGLKNHYYKGATFYINYENVNSESHDNSACLRNDISNFLNSNLSVSNLKYDFIYKNLPNYDFSKIIQKIDPIQTSLEFIVKKYPQEMNEILTIPPLNDGVKVIFKDKYHYEDSYYLGEWNLEKPWIRHGRGKYFWNNGTYAIGTFSNEKQTGIGRISYNNNQEIIEINFLDGEYHGIGTVTKAQGKRQVEYNKGKFVRWI